jgi:predicted GIY-YIG superfamily endonuclease
MSKIYVLRLASGKYYVGSTDNVDRRVAEHFAGTGAAWTNLYRPQQLVEQRESTSLFDEEKVTKEYMARYGIENVRGAAYTAVNLSLDDFKTLERDIWSAHNRCLRCGRDSHFADNCFARATVSGRSLVIYDDAGPRNDEGESESDDDDDACFRCGRMGHWASECFARTDISGRPL